MDQYKVVIRDRMFNRVVQIAEVYAKDKEDAEASAKRTYPERIYPNRGYTFTATKLEQEGGSW